MSAEPHWHVEPGAAAAMIAFVAIYTLGVGRLWVSAGPGRGIGYGAVAAFVAGMLSLAAGLFSPLAGLAERLFAAHMAVHEIIMAVAAPLIVWSRPWAAVAWAVPKLLSRLLRPFAMLSGSFTATLLQTLVIWGWHIPAFFRAAVEDEILHILQHFTFLAAGLLFWQAMAQLARHSAGAAVGWLFVTAMHTGLLGALLLVTPRLWFPATGGLGLSPLEDQQLGGAVMWIPGGLIYAAAAVWSAKRWIMHVGRQTTPNGGPRRSTGPVARPRAATDP